jgi:hypothetical protein
MQLDMHLMERTAIVAGRFPNGGTAIVLLDRHKPVQIPSEAGVQSLIGM